VKIVRYLYVIFGLLVIIFAWAGGGASWAKILLTIIGLIQIIMGLSQKHAPAPTPPPPPPPPKPQPPPLKPEPAEEEPKAE